jgi:hypothetical protein
VVELLGELGDPRTTESLKQVFLNDPVADVSEAAERALRRLGGFPEGVPGSLDMPEETTEGLPPAPDA